MAWHQLVINDGIAFNFRILLQPRCNFLGSSLCGQIRRTALKAHCRYNDRALMLLRGPRKSVRPCWVGQPETTMLTGNVKWFNPTKGYGFIQPQGGGKDVFVHISAVEQSGLKSLNEGQKISYEVVNDRRGLKAVNLAFAERKTGT